VNMWQQLVTLVICGGAIVGFWAWVRSRVNVMTAEIEVIKAWRAMVEERCASRGVEHACVFERLFSRFDTLHEALNLRDSEVARALGRLEGTVESMHKDVNKGEHKNG